MAHVDREQYPDWRATALGAITERRELEVVLDLARAAFVAVTAVKPNKT